MDFSTFPGPILLTKNYSNKIETLYSYTSDIFMSKDVSQITNAKIVEEEVDKLRKQMVDNHFDRLNRGECVASSSGVFVNLVNNLERAADHMMFIADNVYEAKIQSGK